MDINPVTASLYSTAQLQEIEFTDQKVQPQPKELVCQLPQLYMNLLIYRDTLKRNNSQL